MKRKLDEGEINDLSCKKIKLLPESDGIKQIKKNSKKRKKKVSKSNICESIDTNHKPVVEKMSKGMRDTTQKQATKERKRIKGLRDTTQKQARKERKRIKSAENKLKNDSCVKNEKDCPKKTKPKMDKNDPLDTKMVKSEECGNEEHNTKRSGKKYTKWERHKFKKMKSKCEISDGNVQDQNRNKKQKGSRISVGLRTDGVSSNWKHLQESLGIKKRKNNKPPFEKPRTEKLSSGQQENPHKEKEPEIWFDNVDEIFLDRKPKSREDNSKETLVKAGSYDGLTKVVAIDCEMVGVGQGGKDNMLARVSVVNHSGNCIYDEFVKPMEPVVDYRTSVSGVREHDIVNGKEFTVVQKEVGNILKGRILVGHAIHNDLKVLYISHPKKKIRDTSRYKLFRQLFNGKNPSLKKLSAKVLGVKVQEGEHSSVQDAQATMRLYTMYRTKWEKEIKDKTQKEKKLVVNDKKLRECKMPSAISKKSSFKISAEDIIPKALLVD